MKDQKLPSDNRFLTRAGLELAYFSGYARITQRWAGGAGVILRFERVRPRRRDSFQPLESQEVTPGFLDRTIRALKRWKFDIVSMDEVCRRAVTLAAPRRFVSLTFDGGYKDMVTSAYPVLANLKDAAVLREMTMGAAVAQSALHRDITHFAYPFGDRRSWRRQHADIASEAGFASAVSAIPGVVGAAGRSNLYALPRIAWDGRLRSLRAMRAMLSGVGLARASSNAEFTES